MCVFKASPIRYGSTFFGGITGVQFLQIELKPVRKPSVDASLNIFQHKVLRLGHDLPTESFKNLHVKTVRVKKLKSYQNVP